MTTYFLDENVEGPIVRALSQTDIAFIRVQNTTLMTADDPTILNYTPEQGYVLVSHDQATLPGFFWERINEGKEHPGLIIIPTPYRKQVGRIVDFLGRMQSETLANQVWWYPTSLWTQEDDADEHPTD